MSYKLNIRREIPYRRSPMYYSPSTDARETSIFKNCSKVLHVKPNTWHMHSISTILQHPMYGFLLNKNFMIFQLLTWWNSGKTATLLEKHKWIENSFFAKTIVNCDLPDSQLPNFYSMRLTTTKRVTNCPENSAISFFFSVTWHSLGIF